jgi:hypothetical protein
MTLASGTLARKWVVLNEVHRENVVGYGQITLAP